jgi:hypothetical protein
MIPGKIGTRRTCHGGRQGVMDRLKTVEQGGSGKSSQHAVVQSPAAPKRVLDDFRPARTSPEAEKRGEITVVIAKSLDEIEALRDIWREMQNNESSAKPNVDMDRFISVLKAGNNAARPHVILFKQGDRPTAMVIARAEEHRLNLKLGYKALLRPRLRCLNVVYGGVLGQPQGELCSTIISELIGQLKSREFDGVYFNYLRADTDLYRAVRETPGFFTRGHFPRVNEHWRMSVPDNIDQFYKARSRGHRRNLRQAVREFEREYPCRNNLVRFTKEHEVDDFVRVAAEISSKTYQNALGVGIVNDEQTRSRIRTAARHGWFDGGVLFAGDDPCAFQLGLRYKDVYYMVSIGYDPALSSHRAGTVLFLKVLESLCEDSVINTMDFYFGDAEYKKRYGTVHWPEACVYIFAPRVYPISLNVLRCSITGVNAALAFLVNKIGSADWIKRRWRNVLRARS